MPTPSPRIKFKVARGDYANLFSSLADFEEGELCYARDQDILYVKENGALVPLTLTLGSALADYIREITGISQSGEPMGHADKTQSEIEFNVPSRTFSISPVGTSFTVWCAGIEFVFTETESIQLPNTTGLYYIFFDQNGQLGYQLDFFDWDSQAPTAYVYWNASTQEAVYFGEERHGITLDWQTHEYLHRTRGSALANGFDINGYNTGGSGDLDAHAQFSLAGGTFFDEDLQVDVVHSETPVANTWQQHITSPCRAPVLYRANSSYRVDSPTDYPFKLGTTYPVYNLVTGSTWSLVEAGANKYIVSFIIATNNLNFPVLAVMGQAQYNNIADAQAVSFATLNLAGFPSREFRPLYRLIFQVGAYANTPNARLRDVQDIRYATLGSQTPVDLTSEQIQDYAAQLFTNGIHSGIEFAYDDVENRIDASADVLSVNGQIGAVSLDMVDAADAALSYTDTSLSSWTATGTSNPPAFAQVSQNGNTLYFDTHPFNHASNLNAGDLILLNSDLFTVSSASYANGDSFWTLVLAGGTVPTYTNGQTVQLFKRTDNALVDKDVWTYNSTRQKWEPKQALQATDIPELVEPLFTHGNHTGITFAWDVVNNHLEATVTQIGSSVARGSVSASYIINAGATGIFDITLPKSCLINKITIDKAAWFRLYNSNTARSDDTFRERTTDPTGASGVIFEVISTTSQTFSLSPIPSAINNQSTVSNTYPVRITNDAATANISITIDYLELEP